MGSCLSNTISADYRVVRMAAEGHEAAKEGLSAGDGAWRQAGPGRSTLGRRLRPGARNARAMASGTRIYCGPGIVPIALTRTR